jgi:hypothetical protein
MALRHIKCRNAALILHQMLNLASAPDGEQSDFTVMTFYGSQAPQRIVQTV